MSEEIPQAVVEHRRRMSIIWLVPLAAALAGAFVAYRTITERGPEITLTFKSAEGLEAGKTEVRYNDVQIGRIEKIELAPDLSGVICRVAMAKGMEPHLNENTRFWVVRARIAGGQVTGLGTLLGGAYVGMDPGREGKPRTEFAGLEVAPVVTADVPGRYFVLHSQRAGHFAVGTPVFFQKISVGRVVSSDLDESGEAVTVKIFVNAPYDARVHGDTVFWNASGVQASLSAAGFELRTESLAGIVIGGIAFETPPNTSAERSAENDTFPLYESYEATRKPVYTKHAYYMVYFDQSVRGLNAGAPVEFNGIPIGQVVDLTLEYDAATSRLRIPVLIDIQPERIRHLHVGQDGAKELMDHLVSKGLRAQLKTGSLLTGQLVISLDMHEDAEPAQIAWVEPHPVLPTIGAPLQELQASVSRIAQRIEQIPFDKIGEDLHTTIRLLNEDLMPGINAAITRADGTLASVGPNSAINDELRRALAELADAARALELTADELEREPQSLIFGKGDGQ